MPTSEVDSWLLPAWMSLIYGAILRKRRLPVNVPVRRSIALDGLCMSRACPEARTHPRTDESIDYLWRTSTINGDALPGDRSR